MPWPSWLLWPHASIERLPLPIISPISSEASKTPTIASLRRFNRGHATEGWPLADLDPAGAWNLNSLHGLLIVQQQEVTAMKLSIVAVAAVFALSSPAFAQSSTDGLNGSTLGKSMRGVNNGVPYPNTNATHGTVGSAKHYGAPTPGYHRHHHYYGHHRHHSHY
jgi:hypothetical protein